MYKCLNCNVEFREPEVYLDFPYPESNTPEKLLVCPFCNGSFEEIEDEEE